MSGLFGSARAGQIARFSDTSLPTFSFPEVAVRPELDFSLTVDFDGRILSISRSRFAIKESCNRATNLQQILLVHMLTHWFAILTVVRAFYILFHFILSIYLRVTLRHSSNALISNNIVVLCWAWDGWLWAGRPFQYLVSYPDQLSLDIPWG